MNSHIWSPKTPAVNIKGSASVLLPEIPALGLPFLFDSSADAFKVLAGPVGAALTERFAAVNMVPLGWRGNGIRRTHGRCLEGQAVRRFRQPADRRSQGLMR